MSVTQTYAPNEYTIFLSPKDRTRFADFEASLRNELASYLAEHARREGYVMPTRPRVRFETESSLHTGMFGISTALVRDDEAPIEPLDAPPASAPPPRLPPEPRARRRRRSAVEPEEPVRSPLDPDLRRSRRRGGVPLEPEPEPGRCSSTPTRPDAARAGARADPARPEPRACRTRRRSCRRCRTADAPAHAAVPRRPLPAAGRRPWRRCPSPVDAVRRPRSAGRRCPSPPPPEPLAEPEPPPCRVPAAGRPAVRGDEITRPESPRSS